MTRARVVPESHLRVLVEEALDEQRRGTGDSPVPVLVRLQELGSRQVFDAAVDLCRSGDRERRELGVSILRELGPADDEGRRPFGDEAVPLLASMLEHERDPHVERGLLQALAFNGAREALPMFLARLTHRDEGVRTTIAFQLPSLVDPTNPAPVVVAALRTLCADSDPDVRYYALHALLEEGLGIDDAVAQAVAQSRVEDADPQVRSMAQEFLRPPRDGA